jgi:phosphohistidine swiveling domain-containing protein
MATINRKYLHTLVGLTTNDVSAFGGKAAALGELISIPGIRVPIGYVVSVSAFRDHLKKHDLSERIKACLHELNANDSESLSQASIYLRNLISLYPIADDLFWEIQAAVETMGSQHFAIRSSAVSEDSTTASWAGQLDSYLNVAAKSVPDFISQCWSSLFSAGALRYAMHQAQNLEEGVAVIIQAMVESETSGIAFSLNPVTGSTESILIEAALGLGESVVSGCVTPDTFELRKNDLTTIRWKSGHQHKVLHRSHLLDASERNTWSRLAELDTPAPNLTPRQLESLGDQVRLIESHFGFPCDIEWAIAGELYIVQSRPITTSPEEQKTKTPESLMQDPSRWSFQGTYKQGLFSASFWGSWFDKRKIERLGFEMTHSGYMVFDGGSVAYDKEIIERICSQVDAYIRNKNLDVFLHFSQSAEQAYHQAISLIETLNVLTPSLANFDAMVSAARNITFYWYLAAIPLNFAIEKCVQDQMVVDKISAELAPDIIPQVITPGTNLQMAAKRIGMDIGHLSFEELETSPHSVAALNTFSEYFSWTKFGNWTGSVLSLQEAYNLVLSATKQQQLDRVPPNLSKELNLRLAAMKAILFVKQAGAEFMSQLQYKTRPLLEVLANRFNIALDQLLDLSIDDVRSLLLQSGGAVGKVQAAKKWAVSSDDMNRCAYITDEAVVEGISLALVPRVGEDVKLITGTSAQKGTAVGRVKIIFTTNDLHKIQQGDILIATMTTPEYLVVMGLAAAFVTDMGGMLCHAAIVSREMGKPCVVGTRIATQIFQDEDLVRVDASNGIVYLLEKHAT